VAKRRERPAGPLALTQADVDGLITGHRPAARILARRLSAEAPSPRSAKAMRRRGDKAGLVDVTAAELRVLVKGGRPSLRFARRLAAAQKSSRSGEAPKRRSVAKKKEYPLKEPSPV
jgi:hypothetical protein